MGDYRPIDPREPQAQQQAQWQAPQQQPWTGQQQKGGQPQWQQPPYPGPMMGMGMQKSWITTIKKLDSKAEEQYTRGIQNVCSLKEHSRMGQATRTTKLSLDLGKRDQGGANAGKQAALTATV